MELLVAFVLWFIFCEVIVPLIAGLIGAILNGLFWAVSWLLGLVVSVLGRIIRFIGKMAWLIAKALYRGACRVGRWMIEGLVWAICAPFAVLWRGSGWCWLFAVCLVQELKAGERQEPAGDPAFELPEEEDEQAKLEKALLLLGLGADVTRAELTRAYRTAMRSAHSDVGGDDEPAKEVNLARDLIRQRYGWA